MGEMPRRLGKKGGGGADNVRVRSERKISCELKFSSENFHLRLELVGWAASRKCIYRSHRNGQVYVIVQSELP